MNNRKSKHQDDDTNQSGAGYYYLHPNLLGNGITDHPKIEETATPTKDKDE